jgi:hypothetical protein
MDQTSWARYQRYSAEKRGASALSGTTLAGLAGGLAIMYATAILVA